MPSPTPTDLQVQAASDIRIPWREFISKQGVTSDSSWKSDTSGATLIHDIYWKDRRTAVQQILGYPVRTGSSLSRNLPARHPDWEWMYATSISSMKGLGDFTGNKVDGTAGPLTEYGYMRVAVQYNALPYDVFADSQVDGEWDRFVVKISKPSSEIIAMDRGSAIITLGPSAGQPFKGQIGRTIGRSTLTWKWMNVPNDYLFDVNGIALNIEGGYDSTLGVVRPGVLGSVNNATFNGRLPGTLLLDSVEFEPVIAPVDPVLLNYLAGMSPRMWNVILVFKYFNPPWDPNYQNPLNGDLVGHMLVPDIASTQGYWYPTLFSATASPPYVYGAPPYLTTDFTKIFAAV